MSIINSISMLNRTRALCAYDKVCLGAPFICKRLSYCLNVSRCLEGNSLVKREEESRRKKRQERGGAKRGDEVEKGVERDKKEEVMK